MVDIFITFAEGCFPSLTKVKLENGKSVAMSELQIGDKVQTGKQIYIFFKEIMFGISIIIILKTF